MVNVHYAGFQPFFILAVKYYKNAEMVETSQQRVLCRSAAQLLRFRAVSRSMPSGTGECE